METDNKLNIKDMQSLDEFIEQSYDRFNNEIDKEIFIEHVMSLWRLVVTNRNILEQYGINFEEPEMYSYKEPVRIAILFVINWFIFDICFTYDNSKQRGYYEVILHDTNSKFERKYVVWNLNDLNQYIDGVINTIIFINKSLEYEINKTNKEIV